jgi:hypothetical protein
MINGSAASGLLTAIGGAMVKHDASDALLAYVLDHPGETSEAVTRSLSELETYATDYPGQRHHVREKFVKELQARAAAFPQRGVVRCASNGDWYLHIPDKGNYIGTVSRILDALERGFDPAAFDPKAFKPEGFAPSGSHIRIYPPPSTWGTHVSLGKAVSTERNGEEVAFALKNIGHYAHDNRGMQPSKLDTSLFPARWYVIYVTIPRFYELAPAYRDHPHIAVGILGARKG